MIGRRLIGLVGAAGAGKDSTADVLRHLGYSSVAFADRVRAEILGAFGCAHAGDFADRMRKERASTWLAIAHCDDSDFVRWATARGLDMFEPRSPRWLMQQWGTEYRRAQDEAYWLRPVHDWVIRCRSMGHERLVVTDVRMLNEAVLIRCFGGRIVHVHRPDAPRLTGDTAKHSSETTGLPVDAVIHNDSTLDALPHEVARVLASLYDQPAEVPA